MGTKYDFYTFGGDTTLELDTENFSKSKDWGWQLIQARQAVHPLREFQGLTALKDAFSEAHIEKLNIPSQDPQVILVIDYHAFAGEYNRVKPLQVIEACSKWNGSCDAQIYICAYVQPGCDDHSKILARFSDPAFQRVFEGLFVVPVGNRRHFGKVKLPECIREEISNEEELPLIYVDRSLGGGEMLKHLEDCKNRVDAIEKYIRCMLENTPSQNSEE
jgi:hypothetical protein